MKIYQRIIQSVCSTLPGGGTPFNSLWAPYVLKAGNQYRLYHALSLAVARLSVIGLATATSPGGLWTEQGLNEQQRNQY